MNEMIFAVREQLTQLLSIISRLTGLRVAVLYHQNCLSIPVSFGSFYLVLRENMGQAIPKTSPK